MTSGLFCHKNEPLRVYFVLITRHCFGAGSVFQMRSYIFQIKKGKQAFKCFPEQFKSICSGFLLCVLGSALPWWYRTQLGAKRAVSGVEQRCSRGRCRLSKAATELHEGLEVDYRLDFYKLKKGGKVSVAARCTFLRETESVQLRVSSFINLQKKKVHSKCGKRP